MRTPRGSRPECPTSPPARRRPHARLAVATATVLALLAPAWALPANAAGATAGPVSSASPAAISSNDWLGEVNYYRAASGLAAVVDDPSLDQGITDHLTYLIKTPPSYITGQYQSAHTENPASPYYTADGAAAGAASNLLLGGAQTPKQAIEGWLSGPLHAMGIMQPSLQSVAFASLDGYAGIDVGQGLGTPSTLSSPFVFPGPEAPTDLPTFEGELPDPLTTCIQDNAFAGWAKNYGAVGLPLFVFLPIAPSSSLFAQLSTPSGTTESTSNGGLCIVDQYTYVSPDPVYGPSGAEALQENNAVILVPRVPLIPGTYQVTISQPGAAAVTWSFRSDAQVTVQESVAVLGSCCTSPASLTVQKGRPFAGRVAATAIVSSLDHLVGGPLDDVPLTFTIKGPAYFTGHLRSATVTTTQSRPAVAPQIIAADSTGVVIVTASIPGVSQVGTYSFKVVARAKSSKGKGKGKGKRTTSPTTTTTLAQPTGLAWGAAADVDPGHSGPLSLSCGTATFCVAVGTRGDAVVYNGTSWAAPQDIDGTNDLTAVACPTASFCVAVDNAGNGLSFANGAWSAPQQVNTPTAGFSGALVALSCTTSHFCVALSQTGDAITYDGTTWAAPQPVGPSSIGYSVSCANATFCAVVDGYADTSIWNGTSWSALDNLTHLEMSGGGFNSVSCPTPTFCATVDWYSGTVFIFDGESWQAKTGSRSYSEVNSIACVGAEFCTAVQQNGGVLTYNGQSWRDSAGPDPGGGGLVAVSCPTTTFCAARDAHGGVLLGAG